MRSILLAPLVLVILFGARSGAPSGDGPFVCPPCGSECHFHEYPEQGTCGGCGMELAPLASIPQVGVLIFPGVDLTSATLALGAFVDSNAVRAFTVADSLDPVRARDALVLTPQFALADAPRLDVLIVPDGFGAQQDPLLYEWAAKAAGEARFVLGVGMGNVVLGRGGALKDARIPGSEFLAKRIGDFAPGLTVDTEARLIRSGKFLAAKDPLSALDGVLEIVGELAGAETAQQTAEGLGLAWKGAAAAAAGAR